MSHPLRSIGPLLLGSLLLFGCAGQPQQTTRQPALPPAPVATSLLEKVERLYGPLVAARVEYWQQLISGADQRSEDENLALANDFFNGASFVDDSEVWEVSDYWATPLEFIIMDAGDCEDFACAKYFTLEQMGIDIDKLRLTHCKAKTIDKAHMVVAYYQTPEGVPLILDNLNQRILSADQRRDLVPVFSFNGRELWVAKTRNQQLKTARDPDSLKRWKTWQQRARSEDVPRRLVVRDFSKK